MRKDPNRRKTRKHERGEIEHVLGKEKEVQREKIEENGDISEWEYSNDYIDISHNPTL